MAHNRDENSRNQNDRQGPVRIISTWKSNDTDTFKLKLQDELHKEALKSLKVTTMAEEKKKREEYISSKTKEIKEMTIKGLEPEIEKILGVILS